MSAPLLPPRAYVEDCPAVIDVADQLQTLAAEQPQAWARWSRMGDPALFGPVHQYLPRGGDLTITFALHWRRGIARLAWRRPQGAGAQAVEMAASLSRIAGIRWWWTCPQSGRPCAKLYLPANERHFAGREAHRLLHKSEPERARRRAAKLRQALGESPPAIGCAPPPRPLRMREATYQQAVQAIRAAEALLLKR